LGPAALFLLAALLLVPHSTSYAQGGAVSVVLTKSVSATVVESGVPFEYRLSYRCASIISDCTAPVITDILPPEVQFIPNSAILTDDIAELQVTPGSGSTGTTLRFVFKDPLVAGSTGILRFQVQFPPGALPGTTVENSATFTATNATPVTTPPVATTVTGQFQMVASKNGGPAVAGFPTEFTLQVCSPDTTGGVRFTSVVMTDTLPSDAKFISAPGTAGVDWVYTPATPPNIGGTVRYLDIPTIEVGGCLTRRVTLQYDSIPAVQPQNLLTVTGIPEGCGDPADLPSHCGGQSERTLTAVRPFSVIAPFVEVQHGKNGASASSFEGVEARPGEAVTYTVSARNSGYVLLPAVTITDELPSDQLDLISWTAGGSADRNVTVAYQVNNSGAWVSLGSFNSDAEITVASLNLAGGQVVTDLRWEIGDVPVFAPLWSATVIGQVKSQLVPEDPPVTFDNCSTLTTNALTNSMRQCSTVRIIADRAIPRITKSAGGGPFPPLAFVDYQIELRNDGVAHLPLADPVIADLIPSEFTYVAGSASFDAAASAAGAPTPEFEAESFSGGRTLLRWRWDGAQAFSLEPGARLVVRYRVQIEDGTPPGSYPNQAALLDWSSPADPDDEERDNRAILLCSGADEYIDVEDLDGDGNTTERSCQSRAAVEVAVVLAMDSEKFVRGQIDCATYGTAACEDGDYNKLGLTVPGGPVDYRLFITNTSNVSVTELIVIDTFTRVGDTGVIDERPRESKWRPNLQSAVSAPAGVPLTIFYSTQPNPCRPELNVNPPGCTDAQWSTTLPADPTSVQAIKLEFCTYEDGVRTDECLVLPRFGAVQFDWPMVAPNGAPTDPSCLTPPQGALFDPEDHPNCQIAWNSFGFTADEYLEVDGEAGNDDDALRLEPAEPNRVGMRVAPGSLYAVGNLVWLDVAGIERDGIQQSIEQTAGGISGVRVELYNGSGQFLDFRITGPNNAGEPGYYLFPNLPAGSYQVRFCVPSGYTPTLQNQGSDDTLDSDGNTQGMGEFCSYYATEVFSLPNSLTDATGADLSRDFGLWRPADYGDNPNAPVQYPTRAISLTNPADAARHIIVPGLNFGNIVDAEGDGQPAAPANGDDLNGGADDEDGVIFLTPLQPCTTAQVQLNAVTGNRVAAYGAFFDWNGDGVFGPGEGATGQIGTTAAPTATVILSLPVPCSPAVVSPTVYTRFRLALNPAEVQSGTGTASTGEVEDYVLAAVGDRVWYDRNEDGLQGSPSSEPGVPGVVAVLCDANTGQPALFGGQQITTTTDANGIYGFYNLPLASYCVIFDLNTLPQDYRPTTPNAGGDDGNDSDADSTGRTGGTGLLAPAERNLTLDLGIIVIPTSEEPTEEPGGIFKMYLPDVRQ
jgi:uncharacterized repeat protein (TIGR01451 family)